MTYSQTNIHWCFSASSNRHDLRLVYCSWTGSSQRQADPASMIQYYQLATQHIGKLLHN